MTQSIVDAIWREKYRWTLPDGTSTEQSPHDSNVRVVNAVYANDPDKAAWIPVVIKAMDDQEWCPAGRIQAGAGTGNRVTLINCYVSPTIEDSLTSESGVGIMEALRVAAMTQQMGGGIGMDFSSIRPAGAILKRTGSVATGPVPFMGMWNAMCATIMSSGARRGAMMATLADHHPDILKFIAAKQQQGVLTNFNVSVLVSDAFMRAVSADKEWELWSYAEPASNALKIYTDENEAGAFRYVYSVLPARQLWDTILAATYWYAEPGVIFIDRVNDGNNLGYCEYITATNPCGEQPLPPNGACNLGAINLAKMVTHPFTDKAVTDIQKIWDTARLGIRFLDNVLDISHYPTPEQRVEAENKRRTGLGVTGLANMLQQLGLVYGSPAALTVIGTVMETIRNAAYTESIQLAKERGSFPAYNRTAYLARPFIKALPPHIRSDLADHGIRNGVLLTIAPTGTTSIYYDNVSSGLEPTFSWSYERRVRTEGEDYKTYQVEDYGFRHFKEVTGWQEHGQELPPYMVTALHLPVAAHLEVQAKCQKYVDASISKTINCPESMSFDDFKQVYTIAYQLGLKGCTTYRPSGVRGHVLKAKDLTPVQESGIIPEVNILKPHRPEVLDGTTYKLKWVGINYYVTINNYVDHEGVTRPFELFINSKSAKDAEWVSGLTRALSAVFRRGGDVSFLVEELEQVHSPTEGMWQNGVYVPSKVAMIGLILKRHLEVLNLMPQAETKAPPSDSEAPTRGDFCPKCDKQTYFKKEGCYSCQSCGFSNCG